MLRLVLLWVAFAPLADVSAETSEADEVIEEVVVLGKRPGPPLWTVINGDHTLHVFGSLTPLPKSLEWDSERIDWVLEHADEFIEAPNLSASTRNPLRVIGVMRELRRLQRLPEDQTLDDVLPADLYASVVETKNRFAPKSRNMMRMRPAVAARELSARALASVGLVGESPIPDYLRKAARRHGVPITASAVDVPVDEALDMLRRVSDTDEQACMRTSLQSVRADLAASVTRARAWVDGDVEALQAQDFPDVETSCTHALFQGKRARAARKEAKDLWLSAAERALKTNSSTLTVLPMREVFHPDGLLAQLQKRGYEVKGAGFTR